MRFRTRAVTLVEVLVAGVVLLLLTGALYQSLTMTVKASLKSSNTSDAYRACALAQSHLRQELRGARVVGVGDGTSLEYQKLQTDEAGTPVVLNAAGEPAWSPAVSLISLDSEGRLILQGEAGSRVLARLGNKGAVSFSQPSNNILHMELVAENQKSQGDSTRSGLYRTRMQLYLANQG